MSGEYADCPGCGEHAVLAAGWLSDGGPDDIAAWHKRCTPGVSGRPEILPVDTEMEILFQRVVDKTEAGLRAFQGPVTIRDDAARDIAGQMAVGVLNALRVMSGRQLAVLLAREANRHAAYVIHEPPQYTEDEIGNVSG